MKFTQQERDIIRKIYYATSLTEPQIEECFRGLAVAYTEALMVNNPIIIPLLGEFRVRLNSQNLIADGLLNDVTIFSKPSETIKTILGQLEKEKTTQGVALTDSFQWYTNKMSTSLGRNISNHEY